jgi:hypothetical protein
MKQSESTLSEGLLDLMSEANDTRVANPVRTAGDPADVYR